MSRHPLPQRLNRKFPTLAVCAASCTQLFETQRCGNRFRHVQRDVNVGVFETSTLTSAETLCNRRCNRRWQLQVGDNVSTDRYNVAGHRDRRVVAKSCATMRANGVANLETPPAKLDCHGVAQVMWLSNQPSCNVSETVSPTLSQEELVHDVGAPGAPTFAQDSASTTLTRPSRRRLLKTPQSAMLARPARQHC
jgi:hypothetical protein